eukprot:4464555-Alexandrium_andersonii.AAC.1
MAALEGTIGGAFRAICDLPMGSLGGCLLELVPLALVRVVRELQGVAVVQAARHPSAGEADQVSSE